MAIQFDCGNRGMLLVESETAAAVRSALAEQFDTTEDRVTVTAPYLTVENGQATGQYWAAVVYPPPDALMGPPIRVTGIIRFG